MCCCHDDAEVIHGVFNILLDRNQMNIRIPREESIKLRSVRQSWQEVKFKAEEVGGVRLIEPCIQQGHPQFMHELCILRHLIAKVPTLCYMCWDLVLPFYISCICVSTCINISFGKFWQFSSPQTAVNNMKNFCWKYQKHIHLHLQTINIYRLWQRAEGKSAE